VGTPFPPYPHHNILYNIKIRKKPTKNITSEKINIFIDINKELETPSICILK